MSLSHYRQQIAKKGLRKIVSDRWDWYKLAFKLDNWAIGRYVELRGNKIALDGITLSVDNPLVTTRHKGSIYFGIYEISERRLSQKFFDLSLPTIEIGSSIGGVACVTNKLLKDRSQHVVCECNPIVIPTLEKNRDINGCSFVIEARAVAYGADTVSFGIDPNHFMLGNLSKSGADFRKNNHSRRTSR